MLRLVVAELRAAARLWAGAFGIALAASVILSVSVTLIGSAVSLNEGGALSAADFEGIIGFVAMPVFLSVVTTVIVLTGVANLTVAAQRQNYARWQIGGITPRRVTRVVLTQLATLGGGASVIGVFVSLPLAQPVFDWLAVRVPSLAGLRVGQSLVGGLVVVVATTALIMVGGARAARRAGAVPAIEALRAPIDPRVGMTVGRWVLAAFTLIVTVALCIALRDVGLVGIGQNGLFVGLLMAITLAALAPVLVPPFLSAWTQIIPARFSVSWYLARNACRFRAAQSTTSIVPLTIGLVLVASFGSVMSMFHSAQRVAGTAASGMDSEANLIIFGAPLVLATLAAGVTVFMSGRAREREFALITAAGGTRRLLIRTAFYEAAIYAVTALLLTLVLSLITAVAVWAAFNTQAPGTGFAVDILPLLILFAIGFIAILAATVIPTAISSRVSVVQGLAA